MVEQTFYSRAKLLISGEYFVLKGANAFALPLKVGQFLNVNYSHDNNHVLTWTSFDINEKWFEVIFDLKNFEISETNDLNIALQLQKIFIQARKLNKLFLTENFSVEAKSILEFDRRWGFGSSSSLISNIAYWANINPYILLDNTFGGSGYDIASARSNKALIYNIKKRETPFLIDFNPNFKDKLYFAWLGNKQDSLREVKSFASKSISERHISEISEISIRLAESNSLDEFISLLQRSDEITSEIISQEPVMKKHFNDFKGYIKNLGAWGGDFILIASERDEYEVRQYLQNKNISTFFTSNELCL